LPFWVTSLIAVVIAKEVTTAAGAFFSLASRRISSGCQSGAYFISKRVTLKSTGAPVRPVEVMIQPAPVRESVTSSRPIGVPLRKMPNAASPGAGAGGADWAEASPDTHSTAAAARAVQ